MKMSNESEFLGLVDQYITLPFVGKASELEAAVREMAGRTAGQLTPLFQRGCWAYLARLSKLYPKHIQKRRSSKQNHWQIFPADEASDDEIQD